MHNHAQEEVDTFNDFANTWWEPHGPMQTLHDVNPLRLVFIEQHVSLQDSRALDVGCGGGILSEAMAEKNAHVTGIDVAGKTLEIAKLHQLESGLQITYLEQHAEEYALEAPASFDLVTCMELLEHVPEPASTVKACADLVKTGGHVFFSTLNRNVKSYCQAILGAEYVLGLLPKGLHHYEKFIKPSELAKMARSAGLHIVDLQGIQYNPLTKQFSLDKNVDVNYLLCCRK